MADEKLLREELEKLVTDGYGDALEYARNEAANAAIKWYNSGAIAGAVVYAIIEIAVKLIRKC